MDDPEHNYRAYLVSTDGQADVIEIARQVRPSLYDLWNDDVEFRHTTGLISECDLFFPDEKVAVFCAKGL